MDNIQRQDANGIIVEANNETSPLSRYLLRQWTRPSVMQHVRWKMQSLYEPLAVRWERGMGQKLKSNTGRDWKGMHDNNERRDLIAVLSWSCKIIRTILGITAGINSNS